MDNPATRGTTRCPVCNSPLKQRKGRGRPRVYCSESCKQTAYEERNEIEPWIARRRVGDDMLATIERNGARTTVRGMDRQLARKADRDRRADYTTKEVLRKFCRANPSYCVEVVVTDPDLCASVLGCLSELIGEQKFPTDDPRWAACYQAILVLRGRVDFITGAIPLGPVPATPQYNVGDPRQGPLNPPQVEQDPGAAAAPPS